MMTVGVRSGSDGPIMYRGKDLAKNPEKWNGKPVTVGHPTDPYGTPQWASELSPEDRKQVGVIRNTKWTGKLQAEAWIDRSLADSIDPRIGQAIDNGQVLEISTGLGTPKNGKAGTFNGREYDHTAEEITADHLAILLDSQGACSIRERLRSPQQPKDQTYV